MRYLIALITFIGAVGSAAAQSSANTTQQGYSPTIGTKYSVLPTVILKSEDGTTAGPINAANPLPVTFSGSSGGSTVQGSGTAGTPSGGVLSIQGVSGGTAVPVSNASLPLPTGASTSALQSNVQSAAGTPATTLIGIQGNSSGVAVPVSAAALPLPAGAATSALQSATGTPTQTTITCGTGSTSLLASSTATQFIHIRNPTTNTATIWINYAGAAATQASPSDDIPPGAEADFVSSQFLPTAAITCIASASTAITVSYK